MTTVMIGVRKDCYTETPGDPEQRTFVAAFDEPIDLDALTPKARALAEALLASAQAAKTAIGIDEAQGAIAVETRTAAPPMTTAQRAVYGEDPHREQQPDGSRRRAWVMPRMRADDPRDAAAWIEHQVRENIPPDWYPVGAVRGARVPSADAGAADVALTRDQVIEYMRRQGQPMAIQGWDTLRGTGHLPEPDRFVSGRPQWRPDTIDAYLARPRTQWSVTQVAERLGFTGPSATGSARKQLSRWGLTASGRSPGRGGESLYDADQVQAAHEHRPGRGRRTDLARATDKPPF